MKRNRSTNHLLFALITLSLTGRLKRRAYVAETFVMFYMVADNEWLSEKRGMKYDG